MAKRNEHGRMAHIPKDRRGSARSPEERTSTGRADRTAPRKAKERNKPPEQAEAKTKTADRKAMEKPAPDGGKEYEAAKAAEGNGAQKPGTQLPKVTEADLDQLIAAHEELEVVRGRKKRSPIPGCSRRRPAPTEGDYARLNGDKRSVEGSRSVDLDADR